MKLKGYNIEYIKFIIIITCKYVYFRNYQIK